MLALQARDVDLGPGTISITKSVEHNGNSPPVCLTKTGAGVRAVPRLAKKSVSIRREKIKTWDLKELATGVFRWTLHYDFFLGYMRGVLDLEKGKNDTLIV